MKKRILLWELAGIIFVVVLGSLLHFIFEWSGSAIPIAPIALAVLGILFVLCTFYPPHLSPFRDSVTSAYGIAG